MKKFLILLLLPLASFGQKLPDFGVSKVRIIETDKTILAEVYAVTGKVNPKSDKLYFWYGSNMIHSTQGGFSGKLLNGNYNEYYLDKNLKEQGFFKKGLKDGVWKSWNDNGILTQELTWKKGLLSGDFTVYTNDGKLKQRGHYNKNQLKGAIVNYGGKDSINVVYYNHGHISEKPKSFWSRINIFKKKH